MQTFVHISAVVDGKKRIKADFWLSTNKIVSIGKQGAETFCTIDVDQKILIIDKWFTREVDEIISELVGRPEQPQVKYDW